MGNDEQPQARRCLDCKGSGRRVGPTINRFGKEVTDEMRATQHAPRGGRGHEALLHRREGARAVSLTSQKDRKRRRNIGRFAALLEAEGRKNAEPPKTMAEAFDRADLWLNGSRLGPMPEGFAERYCPWVLRDAKKEGTP